LLWSVIKPTMPACLIKHLIESSSCGGRADTSSDVSALEHVINHVEHTRASLSHLGHNGLVNFRLLVLSRHHNSRFSPFQQTQEAASVYMNGMAIASTSKRAGHSAGVRARGKPENVEKRM
jgi:hypothetical protein